MNLLWIVIDCLRADRLATYAPPGGRRRRTTPHLDRFAARAVRLLDLVSPHIPTHPAHTTLFSGQDVFAHQIVAQSGRAEPPSSVRLLPELLREAGYFTGAVDNIGRWIERAFERYEAYPRWNHDGSLPWRNGEEVTARAIGLLDEAVAAGRPFFLFLHYWDPHTPYLPPPPFHRLFYEGDERDPAHRSMEPVWRSEWFASYFAEWIEGVTDIEFVKAQYDASVAYGDTCIARVFQALTDRHLWERTLVVVGADHGEELDEHGCWFDHHGLYETNVHIPLLIRFPEERWAGQPVAGLCSAVDVAPTLLAALGLERLAEAAGMQGRNLLPHFAAGEIPDAPGIYLTECTWMRKRGWRTPRWKLIRALEPDFYGKPPVELYDLVNDPGEQENLAPSRPEVVAELTAAMEAHVARRLGETGLPDPSVAQAEMLRIFQERFLAARRRPAS